MKGQVSQLTKWIIAILFLVIMFMFALRFGKTLTKMIGSLF